MMKSSTWGKTSAILLVGLVVGFGFGGLMFAGSSSRQATTQTQQITFISTYTTTRGQAASLGLVEYCFSPGGNCATILTRWINQAHTSIHVLMYSFTLDDVRNALIQAKSRGVDVKVVMDEDQENAQGSEYSNLKAAGIGIRIDTGAGLMHDKIAIIDSHIVITGSFNWTKTANQENNENLLVIDNQVWAEAYDQQFQQVWNAAT